MQRPMNYDKTVVSLWAHRLKETLAQSPCVHRLAHEFGVPEVYVQRLVYFTAGQGTGSQQFIVVANELQTRRADDSQKMKPWPTLSACVSTPLVRCAGASLKQTEQRPAVGRSAGRPMGAQYFTAHGTRYPC